MELAGFHGDQHGVSVLVHFYNCEVTFEKRKNDIKSTFLVHKLHITNKLCSCENWYCLDLVKFLCILYDQFSHYSQFKQEYEQITC